MGTLTLIWCWSQTLLEQEMFIQCRSRVLRQGGKLCQGTGARTGKAILTSMAKVFLSKSPQVMVGLWLATTPCQKTGNLAKHFQAVNSSFWGQTILIDCCVMTSIYGLRERRGGRVGKAWPICLAVAEVVY